MNAYDRPARLNSLLDALKAGGWNPVLLYDGEENHEPPAGSYLSRDFIHEYVFDLDISWLEFANAEGREHRIMLVPENDEDMLSDWNYSADDADGFNALLEKWYGFEEN